MNKAVADELNFHKKEVFYPNISISINKKILKVLNFKIRERHP